MELTEQNEPSRPSSSVASLDPLLLEARQCLQRADLEGASARLDQVLRRDATTPELQVALALLEASQQRIDALERELRFSMALVALLFFTGVWGFWRGAVRGDTNASAGGTDARAMMALTPRQRPISRRQQRRSPVVHVGQGIGTSRREPRTPRRVVPRYRPVPQPRTLGRVVLRHRPIPRVRPHSSVRLRRSLPPASQVRKRDAAMRARSSTKRRFLHSTAQVRKGLRRQRDGRRRWRPLRFGDPAHHSEVPRHWCGRGYRYGPYYPCLRRRRRRCIKRSTHRKYGCLRRRRHRRR